MKYTEQYWNDVKKVIDVVPDKKKLFGKSILITGASGMICSTVVDLLLSLNRIYGAKIKVFAAGRSEQRIEERFDGFGVDDGLYFWHYDAVSQGEQCFSDDVNYIIHGASNANPAIYMKEPVETILANVIGLNNILKIANEKAADRILYVSSSEVYGKKNTPGPYSENDYSFVDILNERAGYPSSKRTGESLCIAYGMEYGVESVIVRPGHIYGPSITQADTRASADFTKKAIAGENIVMKSAGSQIRSYCYTLDCASAILTVLLRGKEREAYNISNPKSICTIKDIANEIASCAGIKVIMDVPTDLEKRSYNLMDNSSLQADKLEGLGWKPLFPLKEGVQSMLSVLLSK